MLREIGMKDALALTEVCRAFDPLSRLLFVLPLIFIC